MFFAVSDGCGFVPMIGLLMAAIGSNGFGPLPIQSLAEKAFGADAPWYIQNIPFFECSDGAIQQIYYYRWQLYKAHIRDIGERGTVITEFLDDVPWQKSPFASLNDATPFHIREGRWLRDPHPVNEYIDYLYVGGGNDRHFSESVADATYQNFLARGDLDFAARYLPAMRHVFNLWDDHFDFQKGAYWVEPLLDATEYTISSIDASGGKDGFFGGQAFRPTVNSFQYGNAKAIARLSLLTHDTKTAKEFDDRATKLKQVVQRDLWSDPLEHFIDRYQVNNEFVKYWTPIRGRELAGYVPWTYGLPDDDPKYSAAWKHAISPKELGGKYGLRTVEPSYEYYMRQYRYEGKNPECQWNGPSWPFQTTQLLTGLANLLNDYHQRTIGKPDYFQLLRQYTEQHYLEQKPDLQEDYDPDKGGPIVGLDRSHHYNHSGYVDLIVTGLCGIRPQENDQLVVNPLIPNAAAMPYFCLQNLPYHGHDITVIWDADGSRYHLGKGLSAFVDGQKKGNLDGLGKLEFSVGKPRITSDKRPINTALNIYRQGFPVPSASINDNESKWQAVDGRAWFFPEMVRGWSTRGSKSPDDWFQVDYGTVKSVNQVALEFYAGGDETPPESVSVEVWEEGAWKEVGRAKPVANGRTVVSFPTRPTQRVRVMISHSSPCRLVEFESFGK